MAHDVTEKVASQYEQWVYPLPEDDLSPQGDTRTVNGSDPGVFHYAYWPQSGEPPQSPRILVAGCGSVAAARYAYNHPEAQITGIDLSSSSLAHEAYLNDKHRLDNLSLHQCPIQDIGSLGQSFDLIDVTGVLHHIAEPHIALRALRDSLDINGVISIMLYGFYGRTGVYMFQEMFKRLGFQQDQRSVDLVKQMLAAVDPGHIVKRYARDASDLSYDSGIVDTFLHQHDKGYTVADCLELVAQAGLVFQGWKENFFYYPEGQITRHPDIKAAIQGQDDANIWPIMELFLGQASQHRFQACRADRDPSTYRLDFNSEAFWDYIPVRRIDQASPVEGTGQLAIQRAPFPRFVLGKTFADLFNQIDGQKSIRDCLAAAGLPHPPAQQKALAHEFFRSFWRVGYLWLRLPSKG